VEELLRINKVWVSWGEDARKTITERDAEIWRLGSEVNALKEQLDQSGPSVFAAETEQLRKENRRWQTAYTNLEANSTAKDVKIKNLNATDQQVKRENTALREKLEQVDDEDVYLAEMEELLARINDSSNTDYDNLSDAIDWLLES
jgi:predicted  nucleic acid-binding Zn-ribbon protein